MIIHHKELKNYKICKKQTLKFNEDYSFIPLRFTINNSYHKCIIQTPPLFIPYGVQKIDNNKQIIDLSFQNYCNDNTTNLFLNNLQQLYTDIKKNYKKYNVNNFLKQTNYDLCSRFKLSDETLFYDSNKNIINKVQSFEYGEFIIYLKGLWVYQDKIWFQWLLLQGKINNNISLIRYSFIDENEETIKQCKYNKMLKMGVPKHAVELQKKLDLKNIPPPPPPPNFKISKPVSKIKPEDLQSIKLKKTKFTQKEKKKIISNHFEPPSLEELQITLSNLKKIKK